MFIGFNSQQNNHFLFNKEEQNLFITNNCYKIKS